MKLFEWKYMSYLANLGYGFKVSSVSVHVSDLKHYKSTFYFLSNPVGYYLWIGSDIHFVSWSINFVLQVILSTFVLDEIKEGQNSELTEVKQKISLQLNNCCLL